MSNARHSAAAPTGQDGGVLAGMWSVLTTTVLVAALALAVALVAVPRVLQGASLTVLTGSMEPTYSPGDMVVVRGVQDAAAQVQVGDAVAFQPVSGDPTLVTHRVVAKEFGSDGTMFVTRGDANNADDEPIVPEQIKGVVVYHVPYAGFAAVWLGDRVGLIVLAAAIALFLYAAISFLRPSRDKTAATPTHRRRRHHNALPTGGTA